MKRQTKGSFNLKFANVRATAALALIMTGALTLSAIMPVVADTKSKATSAALTADQKFNAPFLFHSNWREAPLLANDQQIHIGGIYSSPLVVNGVVYFGSADGFLYAVE